MKQEQKIYIGSGKKTGTYDIVNGSICLDDIPQAHISISEKTQKRYVNITIAAKREPDKWGKTHSISINTWKPTKKEPDHNDSAFSDVPF